MTTPNMIYRFISCRECVEHLPDGETPKSWARLNVGVTPEGVVQVWCVRHNMNVAVLTRERINQLATMECADCSGGNEREH